MQAQEVFVFGYLSQLGLKLQCFAGAVPCRAVRNVEPLARYI